MRSISKKLTFLMILGVRLLSVYFIQTSFVPDEFWQSLEVAHKLSFGYGYLTWEWKKKIRGSVYPLIFSTFYSIFPDSNLLIIHSPRMFQAILSAVGDFFTYKLSCKLFGHECGKWTVFNLCTSWFLFYCSPRTITNVAESNFSACGLYFYPWKEDKHKGLSCKYLWFVGASILMRPTGVVLWLPLYLYHAWRERYVLSLFQSTFLIGSIMFSILLLCDRWCYGEWVVTLYNFFIFNWTKDIGVFYGSHNFFWYFTSGLPVILSTLFMPFLMGNKLPKLKPFYILILWFLLIFSIPSHKEFRFLLPILPLCIIMSSVVMTEISRSGMLLFKKRVNKKLNMYLAAFTILINTVLSIYMGLFHQRGTIDAVLHLSHVVNNNSSVFFLMPCHSTPYYSYIHKNITMEFLTCEPNFEDSPNYLDEADNFFLNPSKWLSLNLNIANKHTLPTHIVMFDALYPQVSSFLKINNYYLCYETYHTHLKESRTGRYVQIYCKNS